MFLGSEDWQLRIKRPWNLLNVCAQTLTARRSNLTIHPTARLERNAILVGPVGLGPRTTVCNGAYLVGPILIGADATIGPNCFIRPFSVLGRRTRVGPGVELKNVLVGHDTSFYHYSMVLDSVIGRNCIISAGTVTLVSRFDGRPVEIYSRSKLERTKLTKFGCVIGNDTVCSGNVVIQPGVVIGSNCRVGFNVTINRNVEDNTFVTVEQHLITKKWKSRRLPPRTPRVPVEALVDRSVTSTLRDHRRTFESK